MTLKTPTPSWWQKAPGRVSRANEVCWTLVTRLGRAAEAVPALPFDWGMHPEVTLNAPVGTCVDRFGRIWLADTANHRILILGRKLQRVFQVYGDCGAAPGQFNLPFRLAAHPHKNLVAVSDLANRRIQVLRYDHKGICRVERVISHDLEAPNGVVWVDDLLVVADEFYHDAEGRGRLVVFSETGAWLRDLVRISGMSSPGLLWPQGLDTDEQGLLYVANTGFGSVVRCNLMGEGVPFAVNGQSELGDLALARDVCVLNGRVYVPGAGEGAIGVYDLDGGKQGMLEGFFVPVNVTADPRQKDRLWVTDPVLDQIQSIQVIDPQPEARELRQAGPPRALPGQLYYSTSAVKLRAPRQSWAEGWPWPWSETLRWWEWSWHLWEETLNALWGRPANEADPVWALSAAEARVEVASGQQATPEAIPDSLPLLPGSLGLALIRPGYAVPGQLDPAQPLMLVSNYLMGLVLVLQHQPGLDDWVLYGAFGGVWEGDWALSRPQGMAGTSRGAWVVDSGHHRLTFWRLTATGVFGVERVLGQLGDGPGQFNQPADISVGPDGRLYVADQFNHRLQILDENGRCLRVVGKPGYGDGGDVMLLPAGVHCLSDSVVVNDLVNRRLKRYTLDGDFIDSIGTIGGDPHADQFWMPYLLSGDDHHVLVPDCALNQVMQYRLPAAPRRRADASGHVPASDPLPVLEAARLHQLARAREADGRHQGDEWNWLEWMGRPLREISALMSGRRFWPVPHWR